MPGVLDKVPADAGGLRLPSIVTAITFVVVTSLMAARSATALVCLPAYLHSTRTGRHQVAANGLEDEGKGPASRAWVSECLATIRDEAR